MTPGTPDEGTCERGLLPHFSEETNSVGVAEVSESAAKKPKAKD